MKGDLLMLVMSRHSASSVQLRCVGNHAIARLRASLPLPEFAFVGVAELSAAPVLTCWSRLLFYMLGSSMSWSTVHVVCS